MNLFVDYIQPLTDWLQANPRWSLFITFFIALTESLAIIGSIIPGSVTMTAIGILAGSGIMRLDLTLLAATLGAVSGDSLSYALGFFYSERLIEIWPFRKYPKWLEYGKDFFARHGGKSVLLGRFIGPLRSLIPVIAGILHMKQWRFLTANILSAMGWSLLYVMPGALIGAASHELSAEIATRLFVVILIALAAIWLIGLFVKWLFIRLHSFLKEYLHLFWFNIKEHRQLSKIYNAFTPFNESNHYSTALLVAICLLCMVLSLIITILSIKKDGLHFINYPIYLLSQSFHTVLLEYFFIIGTQFTNKITIASLYILSCIWFFSHKSSKIIIYLSSLLITSGCVAIILAYFVNNPRPQGLQLAVSGSSFPAINIEIATAFFGFFLFYINKQHNFLAIILRSFLLIMLIIAGLGAVYLGDVWFTDILAGYSIGLSIGLLHYLVYRKSNYDYLKIKHSTKILLGFLISIILSMSLSAYINFKTQIQNHIPYHKEYAIKKNAWWNQQNPILPVYRLNRIGNRISLLNIQYMGDLNTLKNNLELYGWHTHNESFITKLLMRISPPSNKIKFPLFAQLYENRPPELIMTFEEGHSIVTLYIWTSNYHSIELNKPLWIGTIHQNSRDNGRKKSVSKNNESVLIVNPLTYLIPALNKFTLRRIELPKNMVNTTQYPANPTILLIKPESDN